MTGAPLEPNKKRARFQLHLSTCVVLVLVAGALVGLNLLNVKVLHAQQSSSGRYWVFVRGPGWPETDSWHWEFASEQEMEQDLRSVAYQVAYRDQKKVIAWNTLAFFVILGVTANLCESFLLWRAWRRMKMGRAGRAGSEASAAPEARTRASFGFRTLVLAVSFAAVLIGGNVLLARILFGNADSWVLAGFPRAILVAVALLSAALWVGVMALWSHAASEEDKGAAP